MPGVARKEKLLLVLGYVLKSAPPVRPEVQGDAAMAEATNIHGVLERASSFETLPLVTALLVRLDIFGGYDVVGRVS